MALGAGASAPDLVTLTSSIVAYGFDGNATSEQLFGTFEIDHSYKNNSDVKPHIHWSPSTVNAGTVSWNLDYCILKANSQVTSSVTLERVSTASGTATYMQIDSFGTINGQGITIGDHISFRVYRKPNQDTYPDDAILLSVGLHYQSDSIGSTREFIK
jgi:hypothetical protein